MVVARVEVVEEVVRADVIDVLLRLVVLVVLVVLERLEVVELPVDWPVLLRMLSHLEWGKLRDGLGCMCAEQRACSYLIWF